MTVNMEIGLVHPPVGLNLFVAAWRHQAIALGRHQGRPAWLAILVVFLLLITYVPVLSTWLPDLAFGRAPVPSFQKSVA
jgi:C4-dicarboxylate transporter, DctM subunit